MVTGRSWCLSLNFGGKIILNRQNFFLSGYIMLHLTPLKRIFLLFQFVRKDSSLSKKNIFGTRKINSWESIIIPVNLFADINFNNPSDIIGIVFSQNNNDEKKHTLYIDDIELLPENYLDKSAITPAITATKGFAKHVDITWQPFVGTAVKYVKIYRSENGNSYQPVGIQSAWNLSFC